MFISAVPVLANSSRDKHTSMQRRLNQSSNTCIAFKGHLRQDSILRNGVKQVLRQETALFRDMQTKLFVKEYILKNFADKDIIKMVVGACSTGEEAFTYSMLLDEIKTKLSILGFDLSESAVGHASSGWVMMEKPKNGTEMFVKRYTHSFDDAFLSFGTDRNLTDQEKMQKALFDKYFEITNEQPTIVECGIWDEFKSKIQKWYLKKIFNVVLPEYEYKIIKLRDNEAVNCSFKVGDIMNLAKVTGGEKVDVITFANAMYHLTADEILNGGLRVPKKDSEAIVMNIAQNVKANLNQGGIFVLGEDEDMQMMDSKTVPDVFSKIGFEPLNATEYHSANIWRML